MKEVIKLNQEKYIELQRKIYDIAKDHGWHEKRFSPFHWLCLVMTELSEAVEADRNGRRAQTTAFETLLADNKPESKAHKAVFRMWYMRAYNEYIKGSIEEEFADIVIRLLDIACEFHGEDMKWQDSEVTVSTFCTFSEKAFYFVRSILDYDMYALSHSIAYMYQRAEQEGINLDKQIEWKTKYNEFRPYKHGGKKY